MYTTLQPRHPPTLPPLALLVMSRSLSVTSVALVLPTCERPWGRVRLTASPLLRRNTTTSFLNQQSKHETENTAALILSLLCSAGVALSGGAVWSTARVCLAECSAGSVSGVSLCLNRTTPPPPPAPSLDSVRCAVASRLHHGTLTCGKPQSGVPASRQPNASANADKKTPLRSSPPFLVHVLSVSRAWHRRHALLTHTHMYTLAHARTGVE